MQLLFEEFLRKVHNVSKGNTNSIFLIFIVRGLVYGLIALAIGLVIYSLVTGNYYLLFVVLGLVLLGEIAHFLRKSREKVMDKKMPKDASYEHAGDTLKIEKSKNKKLLKASKSKNKSLLSKNKKLLKS